ncbi:MAG: hypothetical protein WD355_00435 [Balneolaceae bacterium]
MENVGVYKTDVANTLEAKAIKDSIQSQLPDTTVSIDLEDCDSVLRVESFNGEIPGAEIRKILHEFGYHIETLP